VDTLSVSFSSSHLLFVLLSLLPFGHSGRNPPCLRDGLPLGDRSLPLLLVFFPDPPRPERTETFSITTDFVFPFDPRRRFPSHLDFFSCYQRFSTSIHRRSRRCDFPLFHGLLLSMRPCLSFFCPPPRFVRRETGLSTHERTISLFQPPSCDVFVGFFREMSSGSLSVFLRLLRRVSSEIGALSPYFTTAR